MSKASGRKTRKSKSHRKSTAADIRSSSDVTKRKELFWLKGDRKVTPVALRFPQASYP